MDKGRKPKELVNVKMLAPTRDRMMTIKNENRRTFQNVDNVLNHLCDTRDNFLGLKGKYVTDKTLSKKEILDKAKEDYEKTLTSKERREYFIEEANRIREKFKEISKELN